MPHDANGKLLEVGDKVTIELTVTAVYPGADFCGIHADRNVDGEQPVAINCQAKQLVKQ